MWVIKRGIPPGRVDGRKRLGLAPGDERQAISWQSQICVNPPSKLQVRGGVFDGRDSLTITLSGSLMTFGGFFPLPRFMVSGTVYWPAELGTVVLAEIHRGKRCMGCHGMPWDATGCHEVPWRRVKVNTPSSLCELKGTCSINFVMSEHERDFVANRPWRKCDSAQKTVGQALNRKLLGGGFRPSLPSGQLT